VEIGARKQDEVQVLRGLSPGDIVVVEGAFAVKSEFARAKMPVD
jgi:multidrug efflux pump subunit AcrA (membrane-fusion protein)